jgi:hypothetical protein
LALAAVFPTVVNATAPEQLTPITPWNIEYATDSCLLSRGFGSVDKPFLVQFERSGIPDGFQLTLTSSKLNGWRPPRKLSVSYLTGGQTHVMDDYLVGTTADGTASIRFWSSLSPFQPASKPTLSVTPEMEAAITEIVLSHQDQQIALKTGPLRPAFAELHKCLDQLFATWGIDPERLRLASRRTTPRNPASWATSSDYRAFAGSSGRRAVVNFRLVVGVDGKVTRCMVTGSVPDNSFDEITCQLIVQRARFQPALDAAGSPIQDTYSNRVRWMPAGG